MKTFKIIAIVVIAIVIAVFAASWWLGFFTKVTVVDKQEGGYILVGENFTGDYAKSGEPMLRVDAKLKSVGINCSKGFGIYYDNPKTTPREKCRSFLGNILEDRYFPRIDEIKKLELKIDTVRLKQSLVIEFPYKSRMSFFIGPMKAYPALSEYAEKHYYKASLAMELYDMPMKKIFYIMQYEK
jgi:hypothetical protein